MKTLIIVGAFFAAATVGYIEFGPKEKSCQGTYSTHAYGSWHGTGQVSRAWMGHDKMLMQRKCFRCGHIDSKASD